MKNTLKLITFFIGIWCSGCKQESEPWLSNGMLAGTVNMRDGTKGSNTTIVANGPYGSLSTVSDAEGNYQLPGLGNGTYEIEFFKEGYGRKTRQGVQIFGNDTVSLNIRLYKMADYRMPELSSVMYKSTFPYMNDLSVAIVTDIREANNESVQIRIFVSDTKEVSPVNYVLTDFVRAVKRTDATQVLVAVINKAINDGGGRHYFYKGQTLYLVAYVCSSDESGEFNEYYGLPVFSTVDEQQHSEVFVILAP